MVPLEGSVADPDIKVVSCDPDPHQIERKNPYSHQSNKQDPDLL
jgi:hypothetical protein